MEKRRKAGIVRICVISSTRAMMNISFLAKNLKLLGAVPETVLKMMAASEIDYASQDGAVDRPFSGREPRVRTFVPEKPLA